MTDLLGRIVILLARVLLGMDTIQAALLKLVDAMDSTAIETIPKNIERIVTNTQLAIQHPTYGLAALETEVHNIGLALVAMEGNITGAISALPAGSGLVNADPSLIANYVWGKYMDNALDPTLTADQAVTVAANYAISRATAGAIRQLGDQNFHVEWQAAPYYSAAAWYNSPTPNYGDIQPGDTVLSWLQRTETTRGDWELDPDTGLAITYAYFDGEGSLYRTVCDLRSLPTSATVAGGAPVWPGLDSVTLGTPVAIAAGLTITEPMHGVIVAITAVAAKQMYYTYDDLRAYRHIGALAFLDDNGDAEGWQSLGFVSAVYCCRSMSVAAAVKIMSANGTVGTVTPWLRSS